MATKYLQNTITKSVYFPEQTSEQGHKIGNCVVLQAKDSDECLVVSSLGTKDLVMVTDLIPFELD